MKKRNIWFLRALLIICMSLGVGCGSKSDIEGGKPSEGGAENGKPPIEPGKELVGCVEDEECVEAGAICVSGLCQVPDPAACTPACEDESACIQGKCQLKGPAGCSEDEECVASGAICVSGLCQVPNPAACAPACEGETACIKGECQEKGPASCARNNDCVAPGTFCDEGICKVLKFSISPAALEFGWEGGTQNIEINSNTDWSLRCITSMEDWCSVSPTSGKGNGTATVSVSRNDTYADLGSHRHAYVELEGAFSPISIHLSQEYKRLSVTPGSFYFDLDGGQETFEVSSNVNWRASCIADVGGWCSVTPEEGSGNGTVRVSVSSNHASEVSRSAAVVIAGGDLPNRTVSIEQIGSELSVENFPTIAPLGAIIGIRGANFSLIPSNNSVTFNDIEARIVSAEPNWLYVEVPNNANCTGPVRVTVRGQTVTSSSWFFYALPSAATRVTNEVVDSNIVADTAGNLYAIDGNRIRQITPGGNVTTFAGSTESGYLNATGNAARFSDPSNIAIDTEGNLYVADASNRRIRKVTPDRVVSTVVEIGVNNYSSVAIDTSGNLYVASQANAHISKVAPDGVVSTVADGMGNNISFNYPEALATDAAGNLYVLDTAQNNRRRVYKVTPEGVVSAVSDSTGREIEFFNLRDITADAAGNLYVLGSGGSIHKLTPQGELSSFYGPASSPHIAIDATGNNLYVVGESGIYRVTLSE
jgi:sugar lactone lactonase YvrE